ncbi:MAG: DUF1499 domain-containing protein [Hyphomonadaceae bacterium]
MEKFRDGWVRLALIVSLLVPVYFLAASLGTKFGLFDWTVGFVQMTFMWGVRVLAVAAVLALIALLFALFVTPRRGIAAALIALAIPAAGLGYGAYVRNAAASIPPIHDISTDLSDPPGFSQAVADARAAIPGSNGLDLLNKRTSEGRSFTALQRASYGDIAPVETNAAPEQAFAAALALAREQGWTIGHESAAEGVIEATVSSFWFGFTDDIAIRVRPTEQGSRIDMRSVSRVGRSDLGANAARMRPYLAALRQRLSAPF